MLFLCHIHRPALQTEAVSLTLLTSLILYTMLLPYKEARSKVRLFSSVLLSQCFLSVSALSGMLCPPLPLLSPVLFPILISSWVLDAVFASFGDFMCDFCNCLGLYLLKITIYTFHQFSSLFRGFARTY